MQEINQPVKGAIHSFESFGSADGPGVRSIIFLQGCPMRCQYCHNADTWKIRPGDTTADELLKKALRYKPYWKEKGGITVSGGEPLLQIDFVTDLFRKAKKKGIHTVLDTSGQPFTEAEPFYSKFLQLMEVTDLVLLDLKHIDPAMHKTITGHSNENILQMARTLSSLKKPVWIRHVLVDTLTNQEEDLRRLHDFIETLESVERVQVLPYHSMGAFKWKQLGLEYPLEGISAPSPEDLNRAREILQES